MTSPSFETWWRRFRASVRRGSDAKETAQTLRRHWLGLRETDRRPYLNRALQRLLQRRRNYGVALFMLEVITDPDYLGEFHHHLQPLPGLQPDDEESHLADLMRILGATGDAALTPAIRAYLLERPIGPCWPSVPWALWPHEPGLFGEAWTRFFLEHDVGNGNGNVGAILRAFLTEPEAIDAVRALLAEASRSHWDALRQALRRQAAGAHWLSAAQRRAVERATR